MEIHTIDSLPEMLDQLYGLKVSYANNCVMRVEMAFIFGFSLLVR